MFARTQGPRGLGLNLSGVSYKVVGCWAAGSPRPGMAANRLVLVPSPAAVLGP